MKSLLKLSLIAFLFIGFASCSSDDDSNTNEGKAKLSIRLTDAPGDYENVFVDVQEVVIKYNNGQEDLNLGINAGIYDLLELTAGVNVLLFNDEVPAGSISQIRLVLGEQNTIVVDGQTLPLATPSAQQSGLKIQVNETLEAGILYEFMLDFDVDKSIVSQGNGDYSLKPVIRATTVAESGAISGTIVPPGIVTMITAVSGTTEISTYANPLGEFLLSGVPDGTYTVTAQADVNLGIPPVVIENVTVVQGEVTAIGEINLEP
ncbi:MAG: carbohydrate-binding protein [Aequorivita sp.]|nr:MAG: carbohydrate-binding protein [Aequorivita sp.]